MSISMAKHRIQTLNLTLPSPKSLTRALFTAEALEQAKENKLLYRRLSALRRSPKSSVEETMEGWIKEGNTVTGSTVIVFVKELRKYGDYKHALALVDWMEKRGMDINVNTHAIRLDLLSKVKGINMAEDYFSKLPQQSKNQKTYAALLANYCREKMVEKALSLYQKMKELNFTSSALVSNNIMTLYSKLEQPEKVLAHFQEMKSAYISPDRVTYGLLLNSHASLNDIESAERVIEEMKKDDQVAPDWTIYCSLAAFYNSSGQFEKSVSVLKKAEETARRSDRSLYEYLLTLYASAGNLAEVQRVWKLLKASYEKTTNRSYLTMLSALRKLGDMDGLKQCFEEWESGYESYDVRLVYVAIVAYLRNGMTEEAESLLKKALAKSASSNFKMINMFIDFYLKRHEMSLAMKYLELMKSKGWKPGKEKMNVFMGYFEEVKDVDGAMEFYENLKKLNYAKA